MRSLLRNFDHSRNDSAGPQAHLTWPIVIVLVLATTAEGRLLAQAASQPEPAAASDSDGGQSSEPEEQPDLRKQKLEIGLILTGGIVVLGVFLVVLILLYGRRTRRQLAAGRGASAARDELWYLKHPRADSSETDQDGG